MALGKPFSIYRRQKKYYVRFKLPDGTWSTAKSTGQTSKGRAEAWCIEYLHRGKIVVRENVTLAEFAHNFFDWDSSWAMDKRARGLRTSERHCRAMDELTRLHLVPQLGGVRLTAIDRGVIKDFRNSLFSAGLSGATINKTLCALKAILDDAEERSLIQRTPRIEKAAVKTRHKGILTMEEVRRLFSVVWEDFRGYVGNRIAATTGLRLGEILALTREDLHPTEPRLTVRRSWDIRLRRMNETTKTGRARAVILPSLVYQEVLQLAEINPHRSPDAFLFFAIQTPERPVGDGVLVKSLFRALDKIGITEVERKSRNITFHSHRHFVNSMLINAKIPLQKVQSITGHMTDEMSQRYYHLDDMTDVQQLLESIFTPTGEDTGGETIIN